MILVENSRQRRHRRLRGAAALAVGFGMAGLLAAAPAAAQSLEELAKRNAALEQAVQDLMQEVQILKKEVRATSQTAAAAKAAAETPAPIPAQVARSGNKDVELRISGQVNRGVLYADDGADGNYFFVDNDNSSTRIRLEGKGRIDENFSAGTNIEIQMESNSTATVNQFNDRGADGADFLSQRKLELYFDDTRYGKLSLGQGDTASNGIAEHDVSGTAVILYSGVEDLAGGLLFRRTDLGPGLVGLQANNPTIVGTFNQLDGLSRDDRLRYDTPTFMGFRASTSAIADGRWDVAGSYGGVLGGVLAVDAGVGFAQQSDNANIVSGSISALHKPTGISLTYASGLQHDLATATVPGRNDRNFYYAKLGWQWPIFTFGKTYAGIDVYEGTDVSQNGDYSRTWGLALVQKIDRAATEIFVGFRNYAYDRDAANFGDINAVLTGARIKF